VSFKILPLLDEAWAHSSGSARLHAVQRAAPRLRDTIKESGTVKTIKTFDIALFPYPSKFAFQNACSLPLKYAWLTNRAIFVEYVDRDQELRRLLINPSRPAGARKAPYFQEITGMVPNWAEFLMSREYTPLETQLKNAQIDPLSIDYITFDHLHVQEVGPLLGPSGIYPNAKLLVTQTELNAASKLHPLQRYWYVEGAVANIDPTAVVSFDKDLSLGEGVALVRTPGHTEGNHSICLHTPYALYTISENGVCPDAYQPRRSLIPGLNRYAETHDADVVLNANTLERSLDQYTSMRLECILAKSDDPDGWPNHFSSSELTPYYLAPLLEPTHAIGEIHYQA